MPEVSIIDFSRIATSQDRLKRGRTQKSKNRGEYQFFKDFYLTLRQSFQGFVKNKKSIADLNAVVEKANDKRKPHYRALVQKYLEWIRGSNVEQYETPRGHFSYASTVITCNPELNYVVDGAPKLVKLYLNSEEMTVRRANYITYVMSESCGFPLEQCIVLDLHRRREFRFRGGEDFEDELYREILLFEENFMAET